MSGNDEQFPYRLHRLLDDAETNGFQHVISWSPSGHSFHITSKATFEAEVMPKYWSSSKYKSFQRNLNMWGFQRLRAKGPEHGNIASPFFIRGSPSLCMNMTRIKNKGLYRRPHRRPVVSQDEDESTTGSTAGSTSTAAASRGTIASSSSPESLPDVVGAVNNVGVAQLVQNGVEGSSLHLLQGVSPMILLEAIKSGSVPSPQGGLSNSSSSSGNSQSSPSPFQLGNLADLLLRQNGVEPRQSHHTCSGVDTSQGRSTAMNLVSVLQDHGRNFPVDSLALAAATAAAVSALGATTTATATTSSSNIDLSSLLGQSLVSDNIARETAEQLLSRNLSVALEKALQHREQQQQVLARTAGSVALALLAGQSIHM